MLELPATLLNSFLRQVPTGAPVAVPFSGGMDSLTGALTAAASGHPFQLYTFELEGLRSKEVHKAAAVARHYGDILDVYVADEADADEVADLGIPVALTRTLMLSLEDRDALARTVLAVAGRGF